MPEYQRAIDEKLSWLVTGISVLDYNLKNKVASFQMLLTLIGIIIALYSFFDYKKAFALFYGYSVFWIPSGYICSVGRFTVITGMVIPAIFCLGFLSSKNTRSTLISKPLFPYLLPVSLVFLSMFLSCFVAVSGIASELTRFVSNVIRLYAMIFLTWYAFETEEDFDYVIKILIFAFLFASIYGLIECLTEKNPFFEYKKAISTKYLYMYFKGTRGYRMISVFEHPFGAGMNMGMFMSFVLISIVSGKDIPFEKAAFITSLLCMPCIILTKMRSGIFFAAIAVLPFFRIKNEKFKRYFPIVFVWCLCLIPLIIANKNIFLSVVDENVQKIIKGSTFEMRFQQFKAVNEIMTKSPLYGFGEKFNQVISNEYTEIARGYESIWLSQMAEHGIAGVVAQIIFLLYSVFYIPLRYKSIDILFLSLAYWLTNTITSMIGFSEELYFLLLFCYIKRTEVYKNIFLGLNDGEKNTVKKNTDWNILEIFRTDII